MKVLFVSLFVIIIDQISKIMVNGLSIPFLNIKHKGILPYYTVPVINSFIEFTNVENPGIAFGWYFGSSLKPYVVLLTLATVIALVVYLSHIKTTDIKYRLGIALVIGGAAGNLVDRIFYGVFYGYAPLLYGKVIDFIQVRIFDISLFGRSYNHFPIFNLADVAITFGVIFILLFYKNLEPFPVPVIIPEITPEIIPQVMPENDVVNNVDTEEKKQVADKDAV